MGPAGGWPDLLENVAINLGVRSRAAPLPDLENPCVYSHFPLGKLDFGGFPRVGRHPQAAAEGFGGEKTASEWIREQIREDVRNPEWTRQCLSDKVGIIRPQLFHRIGECHLPVGRLARGAARCIRTSNARG